MANPGSASTPEHYDIERIDKYARGKLIGRARELAILSTAWAQAVSAAAPQDPTRTRVLTIVAMGGEGKTSLAATWAVELQGRGWPDCDAAFAWSFYSHGARQRVAVSSDLFLTEALRFFGDVEMADSPKSGDDKGRRLAQLVGARRTLLILDGLEPLQYAATSPTAGELKDQGLVALLKGLAVNKDNAGLCIVTTREGLVDLQPFEGKGLREEKLLRLSPEAGEELLRHLGVNNGTPAEYRKMVEDVKGHALTLNLLGTFLRDAHGGDLRRRDRVKLEEANEEELDGHAFRVMDAYVASFENDGETELDREKGRRALALLRLLGLFDRPAPAKCLDALWKGAVIPGLTDALAGLSKAQRNISLKRLEDARLLTINRENGAAELLSVDVHPLVREYFAQRLREQQPGAWRAAHGRLYRYLCTTTRDKKPAPTLEDLEPLFQAVAHGCQAGLRQETLHEVFIGRIRRGREFYTIRKLGAFGSDLGAVACFFESSWNCVSPALQPADQSLLLNEAAFGLRALGRLTEALEPMQAVLEIDVQQEDYKNAAVSAINLSELRLMLGELPGAIEGGEQAVTYADRNADEFQRLAFRSGYADVLHQAGRWGEAEALFHEAEQMQAQRQPAYPLLYSTQGFLFCDLLLSAVERAVWRAFLRVANTPAPGRTRGKEGKRNESRAAMADGLPEDALAGIDAVVQRATRTLQWVIKHALLLDIALDHLTLGRAALYEAIWMAAPGEETNAARECARIALNTAVGSLRRAGSQHYILRGLLSRAWWRGFAGEFTGPESAQSDMEEAWEIAERGPMPLFLADVHLARARVFGRRMCKGRSENEARTVSTTPEYPWVSPQHDLVEARRLIEKHGYWRRKEELEDAEAALAEWERAFPAGHEVTVEGGVAVTPSNNLTPQVSGVQPAPDISTDEQPSVTENVTAIARDDMPAQPIVFSSTNFMSESIPPKRMPQKKAPPSANLAGIDAPTIVLMTVNDHETKAVLDEFAGHKNPKHEVKGDITYNLLGVHGGLNVIHTICRMGAGGLGASQQRARQAIQHWKPKAVIAVGIAFGVNESKQKIGDVLVSAQMQDYELGRLNADGALIPRGARADCTDLLLNRLQVLDASKSRSRSKNWPKLRFGLVLCGQKLIDNLDYRESLQKDFPEAIGGEMEGLGVYVSAAEAKVDWIVIKAICDWAHKKNQANKERRQKLAAKNAALVLKAALAMGGLYGVADEVTGQLAHAPGPDAVANPR